MNEFELHVSAWINLENKAQWNKKQIKEWCEQCDNIVINSKIYIR